MGIAELSASLPQTLIGWIAVLSLLVTGALAIVGLVDKQRRERNKESAALDADFIAKLQREVNELKTDNAGRDAQISALSAQVGAYKEANENLVKILQGRDENTKQFYQAAFESFKLTRDNHDVLTTIAASMHTANENTTKLIELLGQKV